MTYRVADALRDIFHIAADDDGENRFVCASCQEPPLVVRLLLLTPFHYVTSTLPHPPVIHISSHSGVMESLWRVTGRRGFKPATGAIVPLLVKWSPGKADATG